jgi:hypothetical protein
MAKATPATVALGHRLCHRLRNGGRRGLEIEVRPADLVRVLDATVVELT